MAINRDSLTNYQRQINESIANHRSGKLHGSNLKATEDHGATAAFGGFLPRWSNPLGAAGSLGFDSSMADLKHIGIAAVKNLLFGKVFRGNSLVPVKDRINQVLETKGYLHFTFPPNSSQSSYGKDILLPFFENPKIKETRKAEYASSKIMNRNEPWRVWTGASPVRLDVSFQWTLPHLVHFWSTNVANQVGSFYQSHAWDNMLKRAEMVLMRSKRDAEYAVSHTDNHESRIPPQDSLHYENISPGAAHEIPLNVYGVNIGAIDYGGLFELGNSLNPDGQSNNCYDIARNLVLRPSDNLNGDPQQVMAAQVISMLDVLRSSVIGDHNMFPDRENYVSPPPLVTCKFGSVLHSQPYVVTSYSIDFGDGKEGYENATLLPRRVKMQVKLESFHQPTMHVINAPQPKSISEIMGGFPHTSEALRDIPVEHAVASRPSDWQQLR